MKRVFSALLAVVMLLTMTMCMDFSASAGVVPSKTYDISVGERKTVNVKIAGKSMVFKFVPKVNCQLYFGSSSSGEDVDPICRLYDSNYELLSESDDKIDSDFGLIYSYTKGKTYYLETGLYDSKATGEFEVFFTECKWGYTSMYEYLVLGGEATVWFNYKDNDYAPKSVSIPSRISGAPVTAVGTGCFVDDNKIESLTIPSSVRFIAVEAVYDCPNLKNINISEGVLGIGDSAFYNIGAESVNIPASIIRIDGSPVTGENFKAYSVSSGNKSYMAQNGVLYSKDKSMLVSVPSGYGDPDTDPVFSVPEGVKMISSGAFAEYYISIVTLPNSLEYIAPNAFSNSHINWTEIPKNVYCIDDNAFKDSDFSYIRILAENCLFGEDLFDGDEIIIGSKGGAVENLVKDCNRDNASKGNTRYKLKFVPICSKCNFGYPQQFSGKVITTCQNSCYAINIKKAITGVTAKDIKADSISLEWDIVSGAAGYDVQIHIGGKWVSTKVNARRASLTGLSGNTKYAVRIAAYDKNEKYITDWCSINYFTTLNQVTGIKTTARSDDGKRLRITWDVLSGADGYNVYRLVNGNWIYSGAVSENYMIFNVTPGYEYYYKVAAYSGDPANEYGMSEVHHTCASCIPVDTAPKLQSTGKGVLVVNWNTVRCHGYLVQYSATADFKNPTSAYVKSQTSYKKTFNNLKSGQTYYVRIRSYRYLDDKIVYGPYSPTASIKVK